MIIGDIKIGGITMLNEKNKSIKKSTKESRNDFEHKYDMEPICSWSEWCGEPDQVRHQNQTMYMD